MGAIEIIELIKLIGGAAGAMTTILAFIGVISKKPRDWFKRTIREESKAANESLEQSIEKLLKDNEDSKKRDLVSLRHSITTIYEEHKAQKKFPIHIKEDLFSLYEEYEKLGGNSYVHQIMEEMRTWDSE